MWKLWCVREDDGSAGMDVGIGVGVDVEGVDVAGVFIGVALSDVQSEDVAVEGEDWR